MKIIPTPQQFWGVKPSLNKNWSLKFGNLQNTISRSNLQEVFCKKDVLKNSKEHTFGRVSFLFKKRLWHVCFPVSFTNFLRTPFLWSTSGGCFLNSLMSDVEWNQMRVGIRNFSDLNFSVSKSYFNSKNHLLLDVFSVVSKRNIDNIM